MKEDVPIYNSYLEVKKGDKIVGVIVAETKHGYVVRSFGGIKGLLTFEDVKEKLTAAYDTAMFKNGCIVKVYALFKKKDQGIALTMSKKKAKLAATGKGQDNLAAVTMENTFFPSEE